MDLSKLERYVALKVKVDFNTGARAGGINPRDVGLICLGWQNFEKGEEIRLIVDDRDVEQYRNVEGIEVIEGIDAIDKAIESVVPEEQRESYDVLIPEVVTASLTALHLDEKHSLDLSKIREEELDTDPVKARNKLLKLLKEQGVKRIVKRKRVRKLSEVVR